ncbi:MAG: hypothetical protein AB1304_06625, partial [Bacteroidota bacterium]
IYCVAVGLCLYWFNKGSSKKYYLIAFLIKSIFIFLITYSSLKDLSFLKVPDEDNYFHDAILFHHLAIKYPIEYLRFWLDTEPDDKTIFNEFFTSTDAWNKAPEFFYNDNRWVVKVHSLLSFLSGGYLSVHRLFSAMMFFVGLWWLVKYSLQIIQFYFDKIQISDTKRGQIFLIASLFPSVFFFTSFVLKESILFLLLGSILALSCEWFILKNKSLFKLFIVIVLMIISILFRPAYSLPFIYFITLYFLFETYFQRFQRFRKWAYVLIALGILILFSKVFQLFSHKSFVELVQYRQERFLDASRGGIFLVNTKKFVRVPYDWNNLKFDSSHKNPVYYIKNDVPIMYWRLENLKDTIIEKNQDTTESFHLLYYIEKANKTYYISPINSKQSFLKNMNIVLQAISIFFFYPEKIKSIMDIIVWIENILILVILFFCINYFFSSSRISVYMGFVILYAIFLIIIISLSAPNTGAIIRYRSFLYPFLFINIASILLVKKNT